MLVTDRTQCAGRSLVEVVEQAIDGGVNIVQLREKDMPANELLVLARQLRGICSHRALFLINDRLDIALLCGADGVQLSSTGLPVAAVRQLAPSSMLVGRSVHAVNEARQAETDGADLVIAGTIFRTPSHPDATPAGTELLRNMVSRLAIPVVAIGGINAETAADCWSVGVSGIAVVSAIQGADDPRAAAASLVPPAPQEE
jgi:thiamine-phosphate pyrophosphorylase